MPKKQLFNASDLGKLAKECRVAAGKNRSQAARELEVARPSLIQAEDSPERPLINLRIRIIEKYSRYKVSGPLYALEKK
jgi:DNA-binding XRE family transcriptional regulator